MNILLHACCGPCSVKCVEALRSEGISPDLFWYNPNIHPLMEYRSRKAALSEYADKLGLELISQEDYGLRQFITAVHPDYNNRCGYCYSTRLEAAARYASEHSFSGFSTTLLISPYQKHDLICEIAERMADKYDVEFIYRDFRPLFREGQRTARDMELYMQKYCGCIFSEEERYVI